MLFWCHVSLQHRVSACSNVPSACCCRMLLIVQLVCIYYDVKNATALCTQSISLVRFTLLVAKHIQLRGRYIVKCLYHFFLCDVVLCARLWYIEVHSESTFGAGRCSTWGPAARGRGCAAQGTHSNPQSDEGQTYIPDAAFMPCLFNNDLCVQIALLWL